MPPFSVGFAQVEHRLGIVRRRLNLLTFQDAAYLGGSLVALAAALVIAVALRGRATVFAVAVWAAAAAVTATLVAATLRVRRRWLSVEQVVRLADRRAALDDRLATLLLDPARARASRLREILLEQILAAAPRWDVDALAPRRVPRSLFALIAALAVLIATSFFLRPPAAPLVSTAMRPRPASEGSAGGAQRPHPSDREARSSGTLRSPGGSEHGGGNAGRAGGAATLGEARPENAGQGAAGLTAQSAQQRASHSAEAGAEHRLANEAVDPQALPNASTSSAKRTDGAQDEITNQPQDGIRQGMGAPNVTQHERGDNPGDQRRDGHAPDELDSGRREPSRHSRTESTSQEGRADKPPTADARAAIPGTGSAANPAGQAGAAATELFGKNGRPGVSGRESPSLPLKLGAFAAMQQSQDEPQRQPPTNSVPYGSGGGTPPPPLSDEQIPDAPLQKTDVAPEHEAMVRRIFTRE